MLNTAAKTILPIVQLRHAKFEGIKKLEESRNLALRTLDSNRNVGRARRLVQDEDTRLWRLITRLVEAALAAADWSEEFRGCG